MNMDLTASNSSLFRSVVGTALVVVLALALSACALGRPAAPVSILAPEIEGPFGHELDAVDWGIQVRRPLADRMRDSERVLVRVAQSRLQAYPGAAWLDNAPDVVQVLTIQALEDSNRFQGVGRTGSLQTRLVLDTELRRFEGVDDGSPDLSAELVVHANLVYQRTGQVVAANTFRFTERASGKELDPLVRAFERAMQAYFGALLPWLITEGQRVKQESDERAQARRG